MGEAQLCTPGVVHEHLIIYLTVKYLCISDLKCNVCECVHFYCALVS